MPDLMADRRPADPAADVDDAFAALLRQHEPRMAGLLRRLCPRDADDVLQDALARAWRYRGACDRDANVAGWLLQVAFRSFLDHRARLLKQVPADDASVQQAAVVPADGALLRDELRRALARLSALQRALLLGFHHEQLSLLQLAARHALPLNTVKSHLHRARQLLVHPEPEDRS